VTGLRFAVDHWWAWHIYRLDCQGRQANRSAVRQFTKVKFIANLKIEKALGLIILVPGGP